jgi:hypothetical protein
MKRARIVVLENDDGTKHAAIVVEDVSDPEPASTADATAEVKRIGLQTMTGAALGLAAKRPIAKAGLAAVGALAGGAAAGLAKPADAGTKTVIDGLSKGEGLSALKGTSEQNKNRGLGALSGAVQGASLGAGFGPYGALIGGGLGALAGLFTS